MIFAISRIDSLSSCTQEAKDEICRFDQRNFKYFWERKSFDNLFIGTNNLIFQIFGNDKNLLGFVLFEINVEDSFAHLLKIVVAPECKRMGIATRLLDHSFEYLNSKKISKFYLEVESENLAAVNLYLKYGFQTIHLKKKFYSDGKDAFIMTKGASS